MILVLAGTQDGRLLVDKLKVLGREIVVSTATAYGASLVETDEIVSVINGAMSKEAMEGFIKSHDIKLIIDATHPYAKDVSINAMAACEVDNIPYFRYERPSVKQEGVYSFDTYDEIVESLSQEEGNVLLTIGSNNLDLFESLLPSGRIFARVLPTLKVMEKCNRLNMKPKNILALQGPFSREMNLAMYSQYHIKIMVTKETSDVGGFLEKVETALEKGIDVYVLKRPTLRYRNMYESMATLIEMIEDIL